MAVMQIHHHTGGACMSQAESHCRADQMTRGGGLAWSLTVVVDGVGDEGLDGVMSALVLEEHLDAETHHVQVILLGLHELLLGHCTHRDTRSI